MTSHGYVTLHCERALPLYIKGEKNEKWYCDYMALHHLALHHVTWYYIWLGNTPCNILYSITTFLAPRGRRTRTKKEKKLPSPSPSNPEVLGDPVLPSPGTHSGAMLTSILWEHHGPLRGLVLLWQDHVTKQQEIHFYGKDKNVVWAIINLGKRNLNHVTSSPLFSPTFVLASFPGQAGRGLGTRLYLSHNVRFSW